MTAPLPTNADVVAVDWQSHLDDSILITGFESLGLRLATNAGEPACRVLDFRDCPDFATALASYRRSTLPTLVIVSDPDQMEAVFPQLEPGDDACTGEQAACEAAYRLGRLYRMAMERRTTIDGLTGLASRRGLDAALQRALVQARPDTPVSVVFADLDEFKRLNDEYGHVAGDDVLTKVSEILRRHAEGCEVVARSGGEEFVILIRAGSAQAGAFAEYLREELAANVFEFQAHQLTLTASFGTATTEEPCEVDDLLRRADEALYSAKAQGRNRVVVAEELTVQSGSDIEICDFENRVRVLTERLTKRLTRSGRKLASRYRQEADSDGLTGVFVRRYFDRRLPREMESAKRSSRSLSLIFLDVDHFGSVNKTHGFPTGDRALRHVADTLRGTVRTVDWIARYGGEEFCVVMPDTALADAVQVAERIRLNIGREPVITYAGANLGLTASLGVAELAAGDLSPEDFAQRAGDKTRQAKQSGRNAVCS